MEGTHLPSVLTAAEPQAQRVEGVRSWRAAGAQVREIFQEISRVAINKDMSASKHTDRF